MNLMMVCLLMVILLFCGFSRVAANVVLIGSNVTLSFDDIEANFAPSIKGSGFFGVLFVAEPLDACSILTKTAEQVTNASSPMLLIIRGGCSFEEKVKRAQTAGFKAVIVYDNEDGGALVAMAGNSAGIKIHAVFVVKATGEELMKHVGLKDMELWLIPSYENSAWSIMAISFISLLAMSAVLATCFFVRRHRMRREHSRASHVREFHGMSSRLVKAMPSLTFTAVLEDNSTSGTCAICLEDYNVGEKLRILPCCHKFHAVCVDSWLTTWRTFCPVCKRDARTSIGNPPASAATPLLSSSSPSVASSSVRSSLASSAIHIPPLSSQSASVSRLHSVDSTLHLQHSFRSYGQTPPLSISRSSMDLQKAYSQRSRASNGFSARSVCPSLSPNTLRYLSPRIPSPSNASPSFLSSSSHQQHPMRFSDSALSFSPFVSTYSLPDG